MGEVAAVVEVEAHDGVAGCEGGEEDSLVGLAAGVGLDVDVVAAEELFGAIAGEIFDDVDELAAAVVALAGIAFGVFVGERGRGGGEDGGGDVVFGGDEFQRRFLALRFVADGLPESGIGLGDGVHGYSSAIWYVRGLSARGHYIVVSGQWSVVTGESFVFQVSGFMSQVSSVILKLET